MRFTKRIQGSHEIFLHYIQQYRGLTTNSAYNNASSPRKGVLAMKTVPAPENRSPLREVAVELLAPRRSSLHSVPQQPIAPLPIPSSRLRRRDLRSSDLSPRTALDGLTFSCTASEPGLFQRASGSPPIKRCSSSPAAPARITSSQTNARHYPKNGQARR